MNDRQLIQLAKVTGERLTLLARTLNAIVENTTVLGRMRDAQGGIRAKAFDTNGGGHRHDATFSQVNQSDPAVKDEADLGRLVRLVAQSTTDLWDIVGRYPPPHLPNDADRLALGRTNAKPDPGCESCARTTNIAGAPRWVPPRSDLANPTSCNGRLEIPMWLCDWCYGCVVKWERIPSVKETERHHRGERVPWPMDVAKPKEKR
jgi:hypothetical protein